MFRDYYTHKVILFEPKATEGEWKGNIVQAFLSYAPYHAEVTFGWR